MPSSKQIITITVAVIIAAAFFPLYAQEGPADLFFGTQSKKSAGKNTDKTENTSAVKGKTGKKDGKPDKKKPAAKKESTEGLTQFQLDARVYRNQGYEAQQRGDTQTAKAYYQKAIVLDPSYPASYNDLGTIYEASGEVDAAEKSYLEALKTDPFYLSAYSNLALLYENKRDLKQAAFYWQKRAEMGDPEDPWTRKAFARSNDILLTLGEIPVDSREQQVLEMVKEVSAKKCALKKSNKELAKDYFEKAQMHYQKGQNELALRSALNAESLDPGNDKINEFIEKLQHRLVSRPR